MRELSHGIRPQQLDAADRLHSHLDGWRAAERALQLVNDRFAGFDFDACLVKSSTVNGLFSTHLFAVSLMAMHAEALLHRTATASAGVELVEDLAALEVTNNKGEIVVKHFRSFASKFAHFFIDAERFPIMDFYAQQMIRHHLGERLVKDPSQPYVAYAQNFFALKEATGDSYRPNRYLDRYLWLAGQYRAWLKNPDGHLSTEVVRLFESPRGETIQLLSLLIGESPVEVNTAYNR